MEPFKRPAVVLKISPGLSVFSSSPCPSVSSYKISLPMARRTEAEKSKGTEERAQREVGEIREFSRDTEYKWTVGGERWICV
eukprot:scaffold23597_cov29-Tisochrysis_lutea.AAC.1